MKIILIILTIIFFGLTILIQVWNNYEDNRGWNGGNVEYDSIWKLLLGCFTLAISGTLFIIGLMI